MVNIEKKISFTIFIDNNINIVENLIVNKLNNIFDKEKVVIKIINKEEIKWNLIHVNESLLDYQSYIFKNKNNDIIYFDNTGESYHSLIWNICTKNKIHTIYIRMSDDKYIYPGYKLCYYDHGDEKRIIHCYKDINKWIFFTKGEVQFFEDDKLYEQKIKKKRFNREIIKQYCKKLNIDIEDKEFWTPVGDVYNIVRNKVK